MPANQRRNKRGGEKEAEEKKSKGENEKEKKEGPSPTGNSINKSFILERSRNSLFPPFQPVLGGVIFIRKLLGKFPARGALSRTLTRDTEGLLVYTRRYSKEEDSWWRQPRNFPARPRSAEPDLLTAFLKRMERLVRWVGRDGGRLWVIEEEFPSTEFAVFEYLITNRNLGCLKIIGRAGSDFERIFRQWDKLECILRE